MNRHSDRHLPAARPLSRRGRSPHTRNVAGMHAAPRCGARTRAGGTCKGPCVGGKSRCRMHGGADGSGGQPGNRNALKHGHYTAVARLRRRVARKILRDMRATLRIVAAERLIGTEAALALARAVDSEPELPLPPSCDWRFILKDAGHGDDLQRMDPMVRNEDGADAILRRARDDGREGAGSPFASSPPPEVRHAEPVEARRPHRPQTADSRDDLQRRDPMVRNWEAGIGQGAGAILRRAQDDGREGAGSPFASSQPLTVRHAELVEARRPHGPQCEESRADLQRRDPMVRNWEAGIGQGAGAILRRAQDDGREGAGSPSASSPPPEVRHAEHPERQAKGEARRPHGPQCEESRADLRRRDPMVRNWEAGIGQGAGAILRRAQDDGEGEAAPSTGTVPTVRHAELVEARRPHRPQTGDSRDDLQRMDPMVRNWEAGIGQVAGAILRQAQDDGEGEDDPTDRGTLPVRHAELVEARRPHGPQTGVGPVPKMRYFPGYGPDDDDDDDWYMTKGTTPGKVWDSRYDGFGGPGPHADAVIPDDVDGW